LLKKCKTQIYQRLQADKEEKSARVLKGIPEKVCIFLGFREMAKKFSNLLLTPDS
jgi:hypothetical protein